MIHECQKCGNCCKAPDNESYCVVLYPSDVNMISNLLQLPKECFLRQFCIETSLMVKAHEIKVYLLRFVDCHCIFLSEDNLCKIYDFRPIQCRKAPYEYFSYQEIWGHIPCLDAERLNPNASKAFDMILVDELLKGYDWE